MPRITTIESLKIVMYSNDHEPAHVHVIAPDAEVKMAIEDSAILSQKGARIPSRKLRKVQVWVAENRGKLLAQWAELTKR